MNRQRNLTAALLAASLFILCAAYQANAAPALTAGGLLQFTSQNEFEQAFPGLPKEDFEESTIGDTAADGFARPLNSSTSNAYFATGDILPGVNITATGTSNPDDELIVIGGNYLTWNNTSKSVGNKNSNNLFTIEFTGPNVNAVGMDLVFITATGNVEIKIYTTGDTLLDTITYALGATPTFFGIYSSQPITKMTMAKTPVNDNWVSIDNIQFGTFTPNVAFYTSKAAFTAAHPGLPVEDFEESPVPPGGGVPFPQPLDSTTNVPAAFSPGDIVEGLQIQTVSTANPATALLVIGDHFLGAMANGSKMVCSNFVNDNLMTFFSGYNAYAVGMDILPAIDSGAPNQTAFIVVYGIFGRILGTTTISLPSTQETFLGLDSNHFILGATVTISSSPLPECIDNIQFGGSPKDLTFYQTETAFRNASNSLLLENFSEGQVPDNWYNTCKEPIDSSTNQPGCFWAGDILPGVSFQTENSLNPACPDCIRVYGRTNVGNTTPMIGVLPPDMLEVSFSGRNVDFVGMSMYQTTIISVYGTDDTLLGSAVNNAPLVSPLDFWGVASRKPIGRITINGGPLALIDDIMFGSRFPWAMFLPAINGAPAAP